MNDREKIKIILTENTDETYIDYEHNDVLEYRNIVYYRANLSSCDLWQFLAVRFSKLQIDYLMELVFHYKEYQRKLDVNFFIEYGYKNEDDIGDANFPQYEYVKRTDRTWHCVDTLSFVETISWEDCADFISVYEDGSVLVWNAC